MSSGKWRPFCVGLNVWSDLCCIIHSLHWRHNGRDGVSNHQPYHYLLYRIFRRRSKKTSKFRVTGLCAVNSPVTGEFPAQMVSNAENASIWWRHHLFHDAWDPRHRCEYWHGLILYDKVACTIYYQCVSISNPLPTDGILYEWVIKFNGLSGDNGPRGPFSSYKPCNHSLYIGIIIFPHIDNTQSTGHNYL